MGNGEYSVNKSLRVLSLLAKSNFLYNSTSASWEKGVEFSTVGACIIWSIAWGLIVNRMSPMGEIINLWLGK